MAPNRDTSHSTAPGRSPSLSPHPDYYLRGGDLHLQLGNTRYRVHSHFFTRESKWWKTVLAGPTSPGDEPLLTGSSPTNAVVLDEKPHDFDNLLWVFYNTKFGDYSRARLGNWVTILRYATRWDFPEVKELAIRYIETHDMDVIERIVLYRENDLPEQYLFPLYMKVASRDELLGLEESRALGYEVLVLIHQARERLRAPTSSGMNNKLLSPIRTDLKPTDVIDIVASTFNISLASVSPLPGNPVKSQAQNQIRPEDNLMEAPQGRRSPRSQPNLNARKHIVGGYLDEDGADWDSELEVSDTAVDLSDSAWDDAWEVEVL